MKLVTQDGRTLEISPEHSLMAWEVHVKHPRCVVVTVDSNFKKVDSVIRYYADGQWHEIPNFYWSCDRILEEVVGEYATATSRHKASNMLLEAWKSGATEFIMPQDTFEKSDWEQFEDFATEHHLTLVSINELGYKPSDTARNLRIWQTTNEFERRNIIVADPTDNYDPAAFGGAYSTSLAKWRALQGETA